jgi:hypothetical protein
MAVRAAASRKPPGLEIERRSERDALEVSVPFIALADGHSFKGVRLSLRQVTVQADLMPVSDEALEISLQVELDGFYVGMPVLVAAAQNTGRAGEWSFEILAMSPSTEAALTQLVRSSVSGWLPSAGDLARGWDEETQRPAKAEKRAKRAGLHWIALVAAAIVAAAGVAFAGQQAYALVATVPFESASVTSQRIDILSPEYGEVAEGLVAGAQVKPGDPLIRVASETLSAAIDIEAAAPQPGAEPVAGRPASPLSALQRRLAALSFTAHCTCTVLWAASPGVPVAPGALLMTLVISDPTEIRVDAWVPPRLAPGIHAGQKATIRLSGDARDQSATVVGVTYDDAPVAKVGLASRGDMATVTMKLDATDITLVPGQPATGVIYK